MTHRTLALGSHNFHRTFGHGKWHCFYPFRVSSPRTIVLGVTCVFSNSAKWILQHFRLCLAAKITKVKVPWVKERYLIWTHVNRNVTVNRKKSTSLSRFLWSSGFIIAWSMWSFNSVMFMTMPVFFSTVPRIVTSTKWTENTQKNMDKIEWQLMTSYMCVYLCWLCACAQTKKNRQPLVVQCSLTGVIVSVAIHIVALAVNQFILFFAQIQTAKERRNWICGEKKRPRHCDRNPFEIWQTCADDGRHWNILFASNMQSGVTFSSIHLEYVSKWNWIEIKKK